MRRVRKTEALFIHLIAMEQKDYNELLDTFIEGNADTDTNERLRKFFAKSSPNREFEE